MAHGTHHEDHVTIIGSDCRCHTRSQLSVNTGVRQRTRIDRIQWSRRRFDITVFRRNHA